MISKSLLLGLSLSLLFQAACSNAPKVTSRPKQLLPYPAPASQTAKATESSTDLPAGVYKAEGIRLTAEGLTPAEGFRLAESLAQARSFVEQYWGGRSRRDVVSTVNPELPETTPLVDAWSGRKRVLDLAKTELQKKPALIHYMTHVLAPNQSRFLAEGLAVFLQEKLGEDPTFPNFGQPVETLLRLEAPKTQLTQFDKLSLPKKLGDPAQPEGVTAHLVAGSFVKFLIRRYGKRRFRRLYAITPLTPKKRNIKIFANRYLSVYGKTLKELQSEWRTWVATS